MCGRYTLRTPAARLMELFHVAQLPTLSPRYNIAPTQLVLAIRQSAEIASLREAIMMRWGLVPFWAKDLAIGSTMINARSETVAEKPAFRNAFKRQRCLIPADGFYEWQKLTTGKKQPWWIHQENEEPFAMAGLWESWTPKGASKDNPENVVLSCSILTTAANRDMSVLHDRMPVILPIEAWSTWLSPAATSDQLTSLLQPLPEGHLHFRAVSTTVNRPVSDTPQLLDEIEPPEPLGAEGPSSHSR